MPQATLTPEQTAYRNAAKCELAKRSLHRFVREAWPIIEPGKAFQDNWHLRVICEQLEKVTRREIRRLIINVPPRSTKSTIVSVLWPVWTWIQDATHQWLTVSHGADLAIRDALKSRRLLQSPWFQERWGHLFRLTGDQNQKSRYENDRRGYRIALGMTAGVTGEGADTLVIDDPHSRDSAHSELERQAALTTFDETLSTRLNNPSAGAIVVIMQRLHTNDLTGHLLERGGWTLIRFPMEFERDNPDPLDQRKNEGDLLWPGRFTPDVIAAMKLNLGSYGYAGQAQQRPNPKGGGIWRDDLLESYTREGERLVGRGRVPHLQDCHVFNVADLAYSSKQSADYTVVASFAGDASTGALYLLDVFRAKIDVLNTQEGQEHRYYVAQQRKKVDAQYTVVEAAALATRIIDFMRREGEPVIGVEADRDKVARAYSALPLLEARQIYVPRDADWWPACQAELLAFPNGAHDDFADVMAYAAIHWREIVLSQQDDLGAAVEMAYDRRYIH
jgi:predicted phage terminase large subunit-like protein